MIRIERVQIHEGITAEATEKFKPQHKLLARWALRHQFFARDSEIQDQGGVPVTQEVVPAIESMLVRIQRGHETERQQ